MSEHWHFVAWVCIGVALGSALVVAVDLIALRRQPMAIMNVVWPLTALYAGPLALIAYFWFGRAAAAHGTDGTREELGEREAGSREHGVPGRRRPLWQSALIGATHCGAGCMLGDVLVDGGLFALGATALLGSVLLTSYVFDFVAAFVFGIAFQYFAIVPMRHLPPGRGVVAALKADALSLTAFQLGMYLWMGLGQSAWFGHPLEANSPVFWCMMQLGMLAGLVTSFPMNAWLVQRGIKEAM